IACSCSPRAATLSATHYSYGNSGGTVRQTTTSDYQRVDFERSSRHDDSMGRGDGGGGGRVSISDRIIQTSQAHRSPIHYDKMAAPGERASHCHRAVDRK